MKFKVPSAKINSTIGTMAMLGLISGTISAFQPANLKMILNPLSTALGIEGVGILPGLLFGLVVSISLFTRGKHTASVNTARMLLSILITATAWIVAVHTAVQVYDLTASITKIFSSNHLNFISDHLERLTAGFSAGSTGAAIIFGGCALLIPGLRKRRIWLPGIAIGGTAGLLLWVGLESESEYIGPLIMFTIWQMAIAAWLGYALTVSPSGDA